MKVLLAIFGVTYLLGAVPLSMLNESFDAGECFARVGAGLLCLMCIER